MTWRHSEEKEAHGEIETEHPTYLAQDAAAINGNYALAAIF
jgi:hypothetical protein